MKIGGSVGEMPADPKCTTEIAVWLACGKTVSEPSPARSGRSLLNTLLGFLFVGKQYELGSIRFGG